MASVRGDGKCGEGKGEGMGTNYAGRWSCILCDAEGWMLTC